MVLSKITYSTVFHTLLSGIALTQMVTPRMTTFFLILLLFTVIWGMKSTQLEWNFSYPTICLIFLYILYLIGIFFSFELATGLKYAEYKLGLFAIPLLLSIRPRFQFSLIPIVVSFFIGVLLALTMGLIHSTSCYLEHGWFFYCYSSSNFSPIHHPSYLAGFLLFGVFLLWKGYYSNWRYFNKGLVLILTGVLLVFYFLCLSLAGMLYLGLLISSIVLCLIYKRLGKKWAVMISFSFPILIVFGLFQLPGIKDDVQVVYQGVRDYVTDSHAFIVQCSKEKEVPGNKKRLILWKVTIEIITEHPFGIGTGNFDYYLKKKLNQYGLHELAEEELNPHNQYLHTALEVGILGMLVLVGFVITTVRAAVRNKNYVLLMLISCFAFNMLFESMLQRQSGILFYCFWVPLLLMTNKSDFQPFLWSKK